MKRLLAGGLTLAIMGLLLWSGARRPTEPTAAAVVDPGAATIAPGAHPAEARVRSLLQDAAKGDVSAYLDAFAGPLRERLEREVAERGRSAFADDLRKASASRKNHAVFAAEPEGDDSARVTVESVYPDRNERQTYRVDRVDGAWSVADVETVRSHQPKAKFGTQASYIAPEGVPVQGAAPPAGAEGNDDGTDPTAGEAPTP